MSYHIVQGNMEYSIKMRNSTLPTLAGEDITISVIGGIAYANSARIISTDILLNNGVMHVIEKYANSHRLQPMTD
jgi:uncharacterized surface protein with fasciclin (FAS1) repeats